MISFITFTKRFFLYIYVPKQKILATCQSQFSITRILSFFLKLKKWYIDLQPKAALKLRTLGNVVQTHCGKCELVRNQKDV